MAFKIRDLMINIAPGDPGEGDDPCIGRNSLKSPKCPPDDPCIGRNSLKSPVCDPDPCIGRNSLKSPVCDPDDRCIGRNSLKSPYCQAGPPPNAGCPEQRTDIVVCVGRRSDVALCVGQGTRLGGCPGTKTDLDCCTRRSPVAAGDPVEALEDLNLLKAQLQAELAAIDEDIKEIEESLQPKTVEEVEDLQSKLKVALEELDKIKSNLENK
jgi:hypothetical protein